ncbi:MAG: acetate--CoA ligase family protein, partial [Nitrospinae bacterium]|nr:acetate--CoA ligase family protein [Nitrospinota bacterium]
MNKQDIKKIINSALTAGRQSLLEPEAKALISAWGISTPQSVLIKKKKDIEAKANKLTPPYALKVVSQDILHKSEAGGVVTNIKNIKELLNVWTKMAKNISHKMPTAR